MNKIPPPNIPSTARDFSFNGLVVPARVVDVYDGDSCKCIFTFNGIYQRFTCRITGIDTPEIRTHNNAEKKAAIIARDKVRELVLHKIVKLSCFDFDKYGRLLVDIEYDDIPSLSKYLINNGYGYQYDGGTKQEFT